MFTFFTSLTGLLTIAAVLALAVMTGRASYENGSGMTRAIADGFLAPITLVMGAIRKLIKN